MPYIWGLWQEIFIFPSSVSKMWSTRVKVVGCCCCRIQVKVFVRTRPALEQKGLFAFYLRENSSMKWGIWLPTGRTRSNETLEKKRSRKKSTTHRQKGPSLTFYRRKRNFFFYFFVFFFFSLPSGFLPLCCFFVCACRCTKNNIKSMVVSYKATEPNGAWHGRDRAISQVV